MKKDKDITTLINEMKEMTRPRLTLENFILPEELGQSYEDEEYEEIPQEEPSVTTELPQEKNYSDIQKEIIQIRKIALSVITRLADNPQSESYDLMKKIWNMIDKVNDNKNEIQRNK